MGTAPTRSQARPCLLRSGRGEQGPEPVEELVGVPWARWRVSDEEAVVEGAVEDVERRIGVEVVA